MDTEKLVRYHQEGCVGYIMFNRPPANAYNLAFHLDFEQAIQAACADSKINAVIIKSNSSKFFCAGADIKEFQSNTLEQNQSMVDKARKNLDAMEASDKVFIAQLEGHTMGGGLEIALACDVRFAADKSFLIGMSEIKLGLIPGNGGTQRLTRLVGVATAMDLLLGGDNISPQEAKKLGLVNKLFAEQDVESQVLQFAMRLGSGPALAIAATKKAIYAAADKSINDGLALERNLSDQLARSEDAKEGFLSFVEKRPAFYQGK